MTVQPSGNLLHLYRLAHALIFCHSRKEALHAATQELAKALQARNAILWTFSAEKGMLVPTVTVLESKSLKARGVSRSADFLGEAYRANKPVLLSGESIPQNKHLQFADGVSAEAVLCYPFRSHPDWAGVFEFVNRSGEEKIFNADQFPFLKDSVELVSASVQNWNISEGQTQNQLHAITRLTLLYDISQIFHSTLELSELLPIIAEKIRDILEAETCTIWFPGESGEQLRCAISTGGYSDIFTPLTPALEDDPAGDAYRSREAILLEDASQEERLLKRFSKPEETPVISYMNSPVMYNDSVIGVLELMNRVEGEPTFTEEDHFLLNELSQQAAVSIHNANLLAAERKAKELDALLKVSQEITATLDLNHVLLTIVNQAANVVPFDRASIGLLEGGRIEASAVSGRLEVDRKSREIGELEQILEWTADLKAGLYISELNGNIVTDRAENREKFKAYFEKTGFKAFVAIPLKDEEGELGILCFESAQPYFMDERHLEVAGILANQATVAIRNAQLYRQVPLIDLMQPLMKRKAALMKMTRTRKIAWAGGAALLILLLAIVPWNMAMMGEVTVLPWTRTLVVSEVEGIIRDVSVREGDRVQKDTVLASLVDQDYKLALERSLTRKDLLVKEISRSESIGDTVTARLKQIEVDQVNREIQYSRDQLARTRFVSPIPGVITTPRIEEKAGQLIRKGEAFCDVADMRAVRSEVVVGERDISYLRPGQRVILKMNSYPTRKFYGTVRLLGAQVTANPNGQDYVVQAEIEDPRQLLKPGMAGQAKIEVGSYSVGYVLLRKPLGFLWKKLWVWLP